MTPEQIKQFQMSVGTAAWKLNLDRFADAIKMNPEHDYTREKFKQFSALNTALSQFDCDTLQLIIEAGKK